VTSSELGRSRASVVEKLRQAIREAEALKKRIGDVPESLIWDRPGDNPSVAELLWLIHLADEFRFRPVVDAILRGTEPRLQHVNTNVLLGTDPVEDENIDTILDQVAESRSKLIDLLEQVPDSSWEAPSVFVDGIESTCSRFAADITIHDTEIFRAIGLRLHGSNLRSGQ
jgi:hypothetical protein